jgi:hypothetical protein
MESGAASEMLCSSEYRMMHNGSYSYRLQPVTIMIHNTSSIKLMKGSMGNQKHVTSVTWKALDTWVTLHQDYQTLQNSSTNQMVQLARFFSVTINH